MVVSISLPSCATGAAATGPGLMRMGQIFSEQKMLAKGDAFVIDWVPGTGTIITVKGKQQGEAFKEPEFFNALMRIWLGNNPADWEAQRRSAGPQR